MSEGCKEHTKVDFRLTSTENRVEELESRMNKHSGKVEQAYLKMELIVSKADSLINKVDKMLLKSVELETKIIAHIDESGFWRGFMCTLALMIILQLGAFLYAWGVVNNTVKENYKKIEAIHNVKYNGVNHEIH